jgi:hypothetical protein
MYRPCYWSAVDVNAKEESFSFAIFQLGITLAFPAWQAKKVRLKTTIVEGACVN